MKVGISKPLKSRGWFADFWRRFRRNRAAMIGLAILLFLILVAVFADVIADYKTKVIAQDVTNRLLPPSAEHWFGTDAHGRDLFARVVHGSRISLSVGFVSVLSSMFIGGLLGAVAGYYGGLADTLIMRGADVMLAIPGTLLSITIVAALGPSMVNVVLALAISGLPAFARIVRASVMMVKDQEYIEAARAIGMKHGAIIVTEVLQNCMAPVIVQVTLRMASMILATATLSFLGLGAQPPTPEWGALLAGGRTYLRAYPHITIFPGLAIMVTVLSLNLLGDGLRDALDPRLR